MLEGNTDVFKWPFSLTGLQPHHHRGARPERGHEIIVWIGGEICSAKADGFIRLEPMFTSADVLDKVASASGHDHVRVREVVCFAPWSVAAVLQCSSP